MAKTQSNTQDAPFNFRNFEGFDHPTTTPVPDLLFDHIMQGLNESELKVLLYIIRRTFGFKKRADNISLNQLVNGIRTKNGRLLDLGTGLSKSAVTRALRSLKEKNLIDAVRNTDPAKGNLPTTYQIKFKSPPSAASGTRVVPLAGQGLSHQRDTQQTVLQQTDKQQQRREKDNNNSSGEPDPKQVVVALIDQGISKKVAQRLAHRYKRERILEKIDFLKYLQETSPDKVKNPRGWLRRAIEENYGPPDGYKTKGEREAEAAQRRKEAEEKARAEKEWEREQQEAREEAERQRQERLATFHEQYGTTQADLDLWNQFLDAIKLQLPQATFHTRFSLTQLLALQDGVATIGVPNKINREWLEKRLDEKIKGTLSGLVDRPIEELAFVVLSGEGE